LWLKLILRWLIIAAAVALAAWIVPGIEVIDQQGWLAVLLFAAVLGLVNAFIRPILKLLSCGCIALTLGLFIFIVNAAAFWIAGWIAGLLGIGFIVSDFWAALAGSIIVSIVSLILSRMLFDEESRWG
jgi:putative membrane protein